MTTPDPHLIRSAPRVDEHELSAIGARPPSKLEATHVLDSIASHANLLRSLLAILRRQPQRHSNIDDLLSTLGVAEVVATQIGALADQMNQVQVVGSLACWVLGKEPEEQENE